MKKNSLKIVIAFIAGAVLFIAVGVRAQAIPAVSPFFVDTLGNITQRVANTPVKVVGNLTVTGTCTGCGSGGGGVPGGLNAQVQYNNAGAFGGITGATTNGTSLSLDSAHLLNPTINGAGTGLATLVYPNTASSATLTLPTTTDTLVGLVASQALTNKSVNGVTLTTGGSATSFLNGSGTYSVPASGGSGTVGTSSAETAGYAPFWTTTNGSPALLSGTSSLFQLASNIGIGTIIPNHLLTITGNDTSTSLTTTAIVEQNIVNTDTTVNNSAQLGLDSFDTSAARFTGVKIAGVFTNHTPGSTAADIAFITRTAGALAERMRLTGAGLLGIGTSTPAATLDVQGVSGIMPFRVSSSTGSSFLEVEQSGNVGIGNSNAADKLDVNGNTVITSTSANALAVGGTGSTNPAFEVDASAGTGTGLSVQSAAAAGGVTLQTTSSGTNEGLTINAKGTGILSLATNTTSGGFILGQSTNTISSAIRVGTSAALRLSAGGTTYYTINSPLASNLFQSAANSTASTPRFAVNNSADTALTAGTEAPWVYFNGNSSTRTHASNTAIALQRDFRITGSTHAFATAGGTIGVTEALAVDTPSGGTNATLATSTAAAFGGTAVTNVTESAALILTANTGATKNYALETLGNTNKSLNLLAASSGTVVMCINTTTGEWYFGAGATGCAPSVASAKRDIVDSNVGIEELMKLRAVNFYFKQGDTQQQIGVIADEAQKVDPRLVQLDKDGKLAGMRWDNLDALMLKSIQDEQNEIKALKTTAAKSVQDNWQDILIALLILGFGWQQLQIRKLKK